MNQKISAMASLIMLAAQPAVADDGNLVAELDAVWAELSRTVNEGDFAGMAALYHEDAVLVNAISQASYPIAAALQGWKPDIERTRLGEVDAGVQFRFSQRLHNESTAHETGLFYYSAKPENGELVEAIINFEALLVKKDGEWKVMMEYQKSRATKDEWNALGIAK